ncbi:peroxisome biogenesis factor 10-like [Rhopalosiphum maidis]|uniref:peroxisome biogenesis factor 10-like n=1 Tax=Rhopalosiphum maidis TaxID=43146 RepID=UPI000F00AD14|nr:peroxisome biogenesis factor 10-like [Rhopalosiphum maidis]XP_026813822.1 peroxisome biogenesis factor 10-like [Rhopalosiphum maidis]
MSAFNPSGPAEILRAEQKDEELYERINRQLCSFLLKFKGHVFINKNKQNIFCTSQLLYYALTTLSKLQTLGEEYTKIVQVGKTGKHVPGLVQSTGMILAHVFGDRLIILALDRLIDNVQHSKSITNQAKDQIIQVTTTVKSLVPLLQSLNRVLFYWNGSFYTWAKRFFLIKYIYAVPWYHPKRPLHVFKILSVLTAIHLSVLMIMAVLKSPKAHKNEEEHPSQSIPLNSSSKCSLCLEPRQKTSLSFCGHLFCWSCIHEWLQTNDFCPICRKALNPRMVVPLQNFI